MSKRKHESPGPGMHPSNPYYNNPPNFLTLSEQFPSLKSFVLIKTDIDHTQGGHEIATNSQPYGIINFRDPNALRELTYSLLKRDFSIDLDIPIDSLCPTIPNRMNYICWIEDLVQNDSKKDITGIDIGTGASCIYPLLGCVRNKTWKMIATDINDRSISYATKNVCRNNLQSTITILKNSSQKIFPDELFTNPSKSYNFSMCNPPFYEDEQDIQESMDAKADPPSTICQGTSNEMITTGGEVQFVVRMVEESRVLKTRVQWYTSMVGKRSSLDCIVENLKKNKILNYALTTFRQGRTTRWAIAWSFGDERAPWASLQQTSNKLAKLAAPKTTLSFQSLAEATAATAVDRICTLLDQIAVRHSFLTDSNSIIIAEITGNTWSRAARRAMARAAQESQGVTSVAAPMDESVIMIVEIRASVISASAGTMVEMTWMLGQDRDLFESFFLHLKTKFLGDKK